MVSNIDATCFGMKILYYSPHPHLSVSAPTGYGTHMREMIRAFKELGHEIIFFIGGVEGREVPKIQLPPKSGPISRTKSKLKAFIPRIIWETLRDVQLLRFDELRKKRLKQICHEFQPQVIYERSHYGMTSGVQIAKELKIHHILEVNSPNVQERIALSGPSLLSERAQRKDEWVFKNSNHVLTVSTRLAEMLNIKDLTEKWSVTPNAIRLGQEKSSNRAYTREDLNIPESSILIGFIGSIFKWHGVDLLIDSIQILVGRGIDARALIVGDGYMRPALTKQSEDLSISERIIWTGSVPHEDIHALGQLCTCLIMPKSDDYRSPVKLFEYALCDAPVIAPDNEPVLEIMQDRVHGIIVKPVAEVIADAVMELLDQGFANELAHNWRQKVENQHTWQRNAEISLSCYSG